MHKVTLLSFVLLMSMPATTILDAAEKSDESLLEEAVSLVKEVKEFGKGLGIEPTEALTRSTRLKPANSMLWLWLQKIGTIALQAPMDARIGLKLSAPREEVPVERLYHKSGYSIYFRQGNEFGDSHAVTTVEFAKQSPLRKVSVIFHEDLHGAANFDLEWEDEEALVTPLAALAALKFFEHKDDQANIREAKAAIEEGRRLSQELLALAHEGRNLFQTSPLSEARLRLISLVAAHPNYARLFKHQIGAQEETTVLEAKISHDLAYYAFFDRLLSLYEKAGDLKKLVGDLKQIPSHFGRTSLEKYLADLEMKYTSPGDRR